MKSFTWMKVFLCVPQAYCKEIALHQAGLGWIWALYL